MIFIDLTGQKFNRLTVIKLHSKNPTKWLCKCQCGKETITRSYSLKSGNTRSCGCYHIKHGNSIMGKVSKTYQSWQHMIQRCNNPKNKRYEDYGGRGIKVCSRWSNRKNGFKNFLKDMGERPKGKTLDRINNNKIYMLSNCKWSTTKEQARNKRNNIMILHNGKNICLKDYCKIKNFNYYTILYRILRGWSIKKAITTPIIRGI